MGSNKAKGSINSPARTCMGMKFNIKTEGIYAICSFRKIGQINTKEQLFKF